VLDQLIQAPTDFKTLPRQSPRRLQQADLNAVLNIQAFDFCVKIYD
jgi:hypothetical protein